jgi:hypothetical protein
MTDLGTIVMEVTGTVEWELTYYSLCIKEKKKGVQFYPASYIVSTAMCIL